MADIRGAGESDIRRAGRWTSDALESAYLTNLPRVLLRFMTGFHKDGGRFYLRCAIEKPEPELCRKVFPMVEVWQERINQGCDHSDQSIAADGFLQMLRQVSIVFLPDSVPLQELYPRLSIWNAPLFQDPYKLARSMNEAPTPQDLTLQMAMPLMHDYVRPMHTYVSSRLATLTRNVEQQAQRTSQFLDDLISGRVPFSLQLDPSYIQNSQQQLTPSTPSTLLISSTASNVIIPAQHTNNTSTNNTIITLNTTTDPPYYKMSRGITNIYNLWHEWHIGLSGSPAVLELERTWENQVTKR
ncbi:hypothetical protein INT45_002409 [Circinella minor]|uniref:Ndc10 domain-containing protein n=1 Tax=Circinella minor TaxID=1195481 RepID=A0A8H7RJ65_9FUNG|nr:hypothetical protein INT45_002409 [Circinella minor]